MDAVIYCLVTDTGTVYSQDGATSFADVAAAWELDERACRKYRFDLTTRRVHSDHGNPETDRVVRHYLDRCVGTPHRLMKFAEDGRLPKQVLLNLLSMKGRRVYLEGCAAIEQQYTHACGAGEPCLVSGCALEGEACLQPLLSAEGEYQQACGAEWVRCFAILGNRIEAWRA